MKHQRRYMVTIEDFPTPTSPRFIKVLKTFCTNSATKSLSEAVTLEKYLLANLPCLLFVGLDEDVAEHIAHVFREANAKVAVEETPLSHPMVLSPSANQKYEATFFGRRIIK